MTDPDTPPPNRPVGRLTGDRFSLASEAPLAAGAVIAAMTAVVFGFTFLPQLLALALAGLSLARREPAGRRPATLAIALALLFTLMWAVALGLLLKWWASTRVS